MLQLRKFLMWSRQLRCASLLLVLAWGPAQALEVSAQIKGGALRWVSAQSAHGALVPSIWDTPSQMVPASDFVPGAGVVDMLPLNFAGGTSGSMVSLTLALRGMEYNSPEVVSSQSDPVGGSTANTTLNGGTIQVLGRGLGDRLVQLGRELSPFTHARPIFWLGSSDDIVKAFEDAGATPGIYTAHVQLPLVYEYVRAGVRIRHNWTMPFTINIDYSPSVLTDVTLISPTFGVMTPRYYNAGGIKKVQGEAIYNGTAVGVFTNGLRLRLASSDDYQMQEVAAGSTTPATIPYSITCNGCERSALVINGSAEPGMATNGTHLVGSNVNTISFSIHVSFADVALSSLNTGSYRDQFTLLFEPDA